MGYKIVTKTMKKTRPYILAPDRKKEIAGKLFPREQNEWEALVEDDREEVPAISKEEVEVALAGRKLKKASGPDGVSMEAVVVAYREAPELMVGAVNKLAHEGIFPVGWKEPSWCSYGRERATLPRPVLSAHLPDRHDGEGLYDGVLSLDMPTNTETVAFADDLALLVKAQNEREMTEKGNVALHQIKDWMGKVGLEIAPEKSEGIIVRGFRKKMCVKFKIGTSNIKLAPKLKYLGIWLDRQGTYGEHVLQVISKAGKNAAALGRMMPNIGGPSTNRSKILLGTFQSAILYGAPIWEGVLRIQRYRQFFKKAQRRMLLRTASAYKTASNAALLVVVGCLPIDLQIKERSRWFYEYQNLTDAGKKTIREGIIREWQNRWESEQVGGWTRKLIPNISGWLECKFKMLDFWLTQAPTGHGVFGSYTKRIGKTTTDNCRYCCNSDDPEHTLFSCGRWEEERRTLQTKWESEISVGNFIGLMIRNKHSWMEGVGYIHHIMKTKEKDERKEQAAATRA